jgi:hypothetical protein
VVECKKKKESCSTSMCIKPQVRVRGTAHNFLDHLMYTVQGVVCCTHGSDRS